MVMVMVMMKRAIMMMIKLTSINIGPLSSLPALAELDLSNNALVDFHPQHKHHPPSNLQMMIKYKRSGETAVISFPRQPSTSSSKSQLEPTELHSETELPGPSKAPQVSCMYLLFVFQSLVVPVGICICNIFTFSYVIISYI